ncbi:TetR/AcrR family transcriptional regulator [Achromobacter sp. UMC46]|uniref:TetR/AcrR family transcriptional regulator n=1 Tax=Achromobacter sp. UMC46 TaxID=1862319 RepID=UPI0016036C5D|nr:TetR/AcrR family transcriptional regulator [Achromobacter sp. UMC46]MBB1594316.1 TetR family transcriptional regulator [Achromobacter sp. UMC46]
MDQTDDPGRRARKRLQMLDHLTRTAASLFDAHGYESVTMEQIAAEADVAKRTLYNHFPTKEAVLAYWVDAELERDLAGLQDAVSRCKTFRDRVWCILSASADWCEKHPTYLMAYLRHRLLNMAATDDRRSGGIASAWQQLIAGGQQAGELDPSLPADQLATSFHHLYFGALLRWLSVPGLSLSGELQAMMDLFLNGAGAKDGPD